LRCFKCKSEAVSIFFTFVSVEVSVARFADFYLQLKEFVVCIDVLLHVNVDFNDVPCGQV